MKLEYFLIGFAIGLILLLFFVILFYMPCVTELNRVKERQEDRSKRELSKQGGGCLYVPLGWGDKYFNYHLKSWDSGKHWYAVEHDESWGIKILGDARELYPGLLEHLNAMDALTSHAEQKGPIDLSNAADLKLLNDAGFEISTN